MHKSEIKKYIYALMPILCILYMLLIIGPSEIFFANLSEFEFIYQEFAVYTVPITIVLSVLCTVIVCVLPEKLKYLVFGIEGGCAVAIYIQVMFLNQNLELMGANPKGYHPDFAKMVINTGVWFVLIIVGVCTLIRFKDKAVRIVIGLSVFLMLIQTAALVQLLVTADKKAFQKETGTWYLSGERQMEIGKGDNVIVLSLDFFSNQYIDPMLMEYPGALDCLKDFIYYDNDECVYFGTFPSIAHMLTGCEINPSIPINEWFKNIWSSNKAKQFYSGLHNNNYTTLIYGEGMSNYLTGTNGLESITSYFDNVVNEDQVKKVDPYRILKLMYRFSLFRAAPEMIKTVVYTTSPSMNVFTDDRTGSESSNYGYYRRLKEEGLHFGESDNCFIFTHLTGCHEYSTDERCERNDNATINQTARGCMVLVEEYLNQLKQLGKYDDSTIIITSDHGGPEDPQVIMFMKKSGQTQESMKISHKPISHCEFLPSIAEAADLELDIGDTIDDIDDGEQRERVYWERYLDENYPILRSYENTREGTSNVYYLFKYKGKYDDLLKKIKAGPDEIVPMVDSYF